MDFSNYSKYFIVNVVLQDGRNQNFVLKDYTLSRCHKNGYKWFERVKSLNIQYLYNIFEKKYILETTYTKIGETEYFILLNNVPSIA